MASLVAAEVVAREASSAFVTIIGFGSLLSEISALSTCPGAKDFALGRVRGWRRVFAHPAHIFFERGIARPDTKQIASLSAEPLPGASFVVATFQVPQAELAALLARSPPPTGPFPLHVPPLPNKTLPNIAHTTVSSLTWSV